MKRQEQNNLDEEVIQGFIARCAAVMGANNQSGFDVVIPTIKGGTVEKSLLGLIIVQIRNDDSYTATVQPRLFDNMDRSATEVAIPDSPQQTQLITQLNIRLSFMNYIDLQQEIMMK